MKELVIHIDGASRGNPGPSGIGIVVKDISGKVVKNIKKYIGIVTNNTAEYNAFLTALGEAKKLGANKIKIFLDSELVYKQYLGEYRTNDKNLKKYLKKIREKVRRGGLSVEVTHIPRENNKEADKLANIAINIGETGGD
ncbi:MAG: ribonuclease H [Elusimicrobia bacterium HGW-Elusimicrobia-4]|nr:MAG: ribonuclease H [Elusimicrobia bacterium HGW-Elusimicrobia-4]